MKTLVLSARALEEARLEFQDAADEAAMAWTKEWGRRPLLDGRSFRDLAAWKGVSLWWFAELYLHHSTDSPARVRLIEIFHRLLEKEAPDEVEAPGLAAEEALFLERTCTARGVLFQGPRPRSSRRAAWWVSAESRWNTAKGFFTAIKASLAGPPLATTPDPARTVLFLSHAAFWREGEAAESYEHYFDRLIPATAAAGDLRPFVVAVGPRAAFRRRGLSDRLSDWVRVRPEDGPYVHINRYSGFPVFRQVARATGEIRSLWHRLRGAPALREAFSHRGVPFSELAERDLAATLLLQLPWAVRCFEEMSAVLEAVRPDAVCLYAESSGWGRAALAACRARGVPTVALQHGILYPKYYSYRHDPDEDACPRPDRTAVFGEAARRFLVSEGRYAPESVVETGNPKFDDLASAARTWDRVSLREGLGVPDGEPLVVVASRFRGIRRTHQSIGSAFPALLGAVEALKAQCLVKPHPAEGTEEYEEALRQAGTRRTRLVPPGTDLLQLLHAADALVTVESLSAVEALAMGRPVLVLNMPTNLRSLVDDGVALGVAAGDDPTESLRRLLFDPETGAALEAARGRYLSLVASGVDGGATRRLLDVVTAAARGHVRF